MPTFDFKLTFGELLQIVLTLVMIAAPTAIYFRTRFPLWVRCQDADARLFRGARLAQGATRIALVVGTRAPRHAEWYQLELMERDWHSLLLTWKAAQTENVSLSELRVTTTNGPRLGTADVGANLRVFGPAIPCATGRLATIELTVNATAPWKGGIRVEAGSAGEATRRVVLPVSIR